MTLCSCVFQLFKQDHCFFILYLPWMCHHHSLLLVRNMDGQQLVIVVLCQSKVPSRLDLCFDYDFSGG